MEEILTTTVTTKVSNSEYWCVRCEIQRPTKMRHEYFSMNSNYKDLSVNIEKLWYSWGTRPFKSRDIKTEDDARLCRARLIERFKYEYDKAVDELNSIQSSRKQYRRLYDLSYMEENILLYKARLDSKIEVVKIKREQTTVTEFYVP